MQELGLTTTEVGLEIEKIVADCQTDAMNLSPTFSSTLKLAEAIGTIREMFLKHPGIKKSIQSMQDTKLGFLTDRSPKAIAAAKAKGNTIVPYSYEEIVECCIEAMLKGYHLQGNEFNVIASGFYAAKEGKHRKIIQNPDVTDFKFTNTSPQYDPDMKYAKVQCFASWNQNGTPVTIGISNKDKGIEDTLIFRVKVNASMGDDAVVGKALSKLFGRVLMRITGRLMSEATDVEFGETGIIEGPCGPQKTDLTGELGTKPIYEFNKIPPSQIPQNTVPVQHEEPQGNPITPINENGSDATQEPEGIPFEVTKPENNSEAKDPKAKPPAVKETDVMDEDTKLFVAEAEQYRATLKESTWNKIAAHYRINGVERKLQHLAPDIRQAFLQQCKIRLDKQNQ